MEVKKTKIYFAKTKENAVIPSKREEDGCYDIYACLDQNMLIEPFSVALIPTGIASAFDSKWRLAIRERGSNTKAALITMAGQVDSGYRGEIFVAVYNGNGRPVILSRDVEDYDKSCRNELGAIIVPASKAIAQFAMEQVPKLSVEEVSIDELTKVPSERGDGALGSSGKEGGIN